MNAADVEVVEQQVREATLEPNPVQLLVRALERGVDTEQLNKFMDLADRWRATQARNAATHDLALFKSEPIKILKTKQVNIPGGAKFAHATLADVVDGVVTALSKHGFSHRWAVVQDPSGLITVTCYLTHRDGHTESATLSGMPDDSGKKNAIQQIASTVTYLERYTLVAVCGLASRDQPDLDDQQQVAPLVSEEQIANMKALLTEVGANMPAFLAWAKVKELKDIRADAYPYCMKIIEAKRK